jgi:L-methionine (R)-S-oxide reductase
MAMARSESDSLVAQAAGLLAGERDRIANAANLSALLFMSLEDINWVGFYFAHGDELVVGPFQGKPACVRIPFGRGVCGKAATTSEIIRVADVEEFPDHIVCDVASRSEIVLPLVKSGEVIGVLDIDSPKPARFSTKDEALLSEIAAIYVNSID